MLAGRCWNLGQNIPSRLSASVYERGLKKNPAAGKLTGSLKPTASPALLSYGGAKKLFSGLLFSFKQPDQVSHAGSILALRGRGALSWRLQRLISLKIIPYSD